jgi:hypothetical protein
VDDFDFYRLYKTLHILSVTVLAGGIAIESVAGPVLARAQSVQELRAYAKLMVIAQNFLILPGFVLLVGFGYAAAGRANLDLDATWLLIAQILTYTAAVASLGYLRSASMRLSRMVREAPDGPVTPELGREIKNPLPGHRWHGAARFLRRNRVPHGLEAGLVSRRTALRHRGAAAHRVQRKLV